MCFVEKKDWRFCKAEVGNLPDEFWTLEIKAHLLFTLISMSFTLTVLQMDRFKKCWAEHGNQSRTAMKDA